MNGVGFTTISKTIHIKDKRMIIHIRCLSLSGLCDAKKIGIFIIDTLTLMTVDSYNFFDVSSLLLKL